MYMYIYLVHSLFREKMTHSDLTEDLTASKEKGEEIQAARKRSGQGGAKMTMFTVLLRLRPVLCFLPACPPARREDAVARRTYKTRQETEAKKPVTATIVLTLLFISGAWLGGGQERGREGGRRRGGCGSAADIG